MRQDHGTDVFCGGVMLQGSGSTRSQIEQQQQWAG
jgi:hypothetical protein